MAPAQTAGSETSHSVYTYFFFLLLLLSLSQGSPLVFVFLGDNSGSLSSACLILEAFSGVTVRFQMKKKGERKIRKDRVGVLLHTRAS